MSCLTIVKCCYEILNQKELELAALIMVGHTNRSCCSHEEVMERIDGSGSTHTLSLSLCVCACVFENRTVLYQVFLYLHSVGVWVRWLLWGRDIIRECASFLMKIFPWWDLKSFTMLGSPPNTTIFIGKAVYTYLEYCKVPAFYSAVCATSRSFPYAYKYYQNRKENK